MFDVRDFGAKGDGIVDDRPAIQNAIDAAAMSVVAGTNATVLIPAGTYIIGTKSNPGNQPLVIPSNIRLIGEGVGHTVLKLPDNASQTSPYPRIFNLPSAVNNRAVLLVNDGNIVWFGDGITAGSPPLPPATKNIEIANMTLDANRDGQPILYDGAINMLIRGNGVSSTCSLSQVSNAYLHDLELRNSADLGLHLEAGLATFESGVTNSRFERLWIHHSGYVALAIVGEASDLSFDNCVIEENDNHGASVGWN